MSAEPPDAVAHPPGEPAGAEPPDAVAHPGTGAPVGAEPRVIDARGLRCPLPIIELARAARTAAAGDVLVVWWTDPAAEHDIPAWARMRGHQVLTTAPLPVIMQTMRDHANNAGDGGRAAWTGGAGDASGVGGPEHAGGIDADDPALATAVLITR